MSQRFGFLAFEGVEELDLVGPWEVGGIWRDFAGGPEIVIVGPKKGMVTCARGLHIEVVYDFSNCPPLDYLLVPGSKEFRIQRYDAATLQFIRDFFNHSGDCYLLSVCNGTFILYETGLLKGKHVTTYHLLKHELKEYPDIHVVNARYHRDGKIWTSAGISSGIDMLFAFIAHLTCAETAGQVQYLCEYFPERRRYPFHQSMPKYS